MHPSATPEEINLSKKPNKPIGPRFAGIIGGHKGGIKLIISFRSCLGSCSSSPKDLEALWHSHQDIL